MKIKQWVLYFLMSVVIIFLLSGCGTGASENVLQEKLISEMAYLNSMLLDMLNKANGLSFENYQVTAKKTEEQNEQGGPGGQNGESSSSQGSSGGDNSSSGGDSKEKKEPKVDSVEYQMTPNTILSQDRTPKWKELQIDIEELYSQWAITTLNLYQNQVQSQMILQFNTELDGSAKAIQEKNQKETLLHLSKLYSYLPGYVASFSNDTLQIESYQTKSHVLNAYSMIEQNQKENVKKELQQAEEAMVRMMNDMGQSEYKQQNINKAYILLKDLQTSVDQEKTDIFYLKYKNVMEELNLL